ncbi:MAG: hypothetical protein IKE60_31565 [Reyranella sp.]|uniref:hypothetical protein n=1 Tax=Reyranella sp. TaxID=1929291 RepID=UPI0025D5284B|nr:hypothetical protein [Reyranella sp.]MBR2819249.1 hypothetical protein [Reyranella sp.]
MALIAEGRYEGRLAENDRTVTLRVSRREGGRLDNLSGDVFSTTAHILSFAGDLASLAEVTDADVSGRISGRVSFFSEGALARTGSRFTLVLSDETDDSAVGLTLNLGAGDVTVALSRTGPELRSLRVDVDGLDSLPTPQARIFEGDPAGKDLVSALKRASIAATVNVRPFQPYAAGASTPERLSMGELHSLMDAWSRPPTDIGQAWRVHVLFAGQYSGRGEADVSGVMYDVEPHRRPSRQGLAVFLNSTAIKACTPVNGDDWRREVLFTLVHEIGHALNLPHAFEDNRAQSLTWMNYPRDMPIGAAAFWNSFGESFDTPELAFLHHAPFSDIAPGQNDYAQRRSSFLSGGSNPMLKAKKTTPTIDPATVKATLAVAPLKATYVFGEPVFLKLAVTNESRKKLSLAKALDPSDGFVSIRIETPLGKQRTLRPPAALCQRAPSMTLAPRKSVAFDGILASFDADGAIFDAPGRYRLQATFKGIDGVTLTSQPSFLRVLHPTRAEELVAISIWDDNALMRAIYCRQPLVALDSWQRLVEEKLRLLPDDGANTTKSYLRYVAALGWMERFAPAARAAAYRPNRRKALAHLRTVEPRDLPQGVSRRRGELLTKKR